MVDDKSLSEEVFCLKFELETLSSLLIKYETERWVPGFMFDHIEKDHLDRYNWALNYVSGKKVMDIACGVGKGSNLIASLGKASHVTAYDLDENAIRYAKHRNARENIQFGVQNALKLEAEKVYDVVVSFETIEHIPDVNLFLQKIKAALKDDGLFIVSTPISHKVFDEKPDNPFHIQEWGFKSFHEKLAEFLEIQDIYLQLYPHTPVQKPVSLFQRVINKVFNINKPAAHSNKPITSKIEKYTNQYPTDEIGTTRKGYQLVVCKKKG